MAHWHLPPDNVKFANSRYFSRAVQSFELSSLGRRSKSVMVCSLHAQALRVGGARGAARGAGRSKLGGVTVLLDMLVIRK